jgi:putative spermidine/putrescine transport system ATP-binding protein
MEAVHGAAIRLAGCAKSYAGNQVLSPVTLDIASGETLVFLGPSGCGKTTTLRIVAGLIRPDAGAVFFDGTDVTHVPIERRNVGMVFQSYALFPNMTVAENIGYGLRIRRVPKDERVERVDEMLRLVGIEMLRDRRIDQLSGGQRQRVALARAVAPRPRVLLLDEPLTALDATLRERLRIELDRLLRELRITTIYVTHDQAEAMALGDRIAVMTQGSIAQIGTPGEIYFEPANRFVAQFIGAANILEGPIEDGSLRLPGGSIKISNSPSAAVAIAMLRPEDIDIVNHDTAAWKGRVETAHFLGNRLRLTITEAATVPITVEASNRLDVRSGDQVGLAVAAQAVRVLNE